MRVRSSLVTVAGAVFAASVSLVCTDVSLIAAASSRRQATPAQTATPEVLARQILDATKSNAERDKLVADAGIDAGVLITAMALGMEAGTPEEYVRIPMIWRVALAAGKRNQPVEVKSVLAASLPKAGERLRDWQAVVIGGGIVNGISMGGAWPGERLNEILNDEKELKSRWQRVPDLAAAMADDDGVKTGTRYDALRIVAVGTWEQRGAQLRKYLAKDTPAEVQQGAIAALNDMKAKEVGPALIAGLKDFSGRSRNVALDALLRDDSRMAALLDAVAAGQLTASDLGEARVQKLKTAGDKTIRTRAEQLLR
jgi:hypothetical protein